MTEKTQPTDAEILDAAYDFRSQYKHGGTTFDEFNALDFARAVLAKWGTPQPIQAQAASVGRDAGRIEKWSDRIQRAHPKSEPEFWPDELRVKYMAEEIRDLRATRPAPPPAEGSTVDHPGLVFQATGKRLGHPSDPSTEGLEIIHHLSKARAVGELLRL